MSLVCASAHLAAAGSTATTFPAGSLIVPTNASYQDDCGAVSGYGLIYDVLRAEAWLIAQGQPAITINYIVSDTKLSPNRCIPSNLHTAPGNQTAWNDGCDFSLSGTAPLVKLVTNTATAAASDTSITTIDTRNNGAVSPTYSPVSIANATAVRYLGGAFVISSSGQDAANFLKLLDGTYAATDSGGNAIDFSPFRNSASCVFGATHHVNIHRAQVAFNAPVRKAFNSQPPRLAVLETDRNNGTGTVKVAASTSVSIASTNGAIETGTTATFTTTSAHGFSVGDSITIQSVKNNGYNGIFTVTAVPTSTTFKVTLPVSGLSSSGKGTAIKGGSILENYLASAGLDFDGAQGCPTGGANVNDTTVCANGGAAGQIFDVFDFSDLATGSLLNGKGLFTKDSGVSRYTVLWTPHWESNASSSGSPTLPPSLTELAAFTNMSSFLDGQTGLMGECASISSFEGAYNGGSKDTYSGGLQLQTCVNSSGKCAALTTPYGMDRDPSNMPTGQLQNCSDPGASTTCVSFGTPTDEYVQLGDYMWTAERGYIQGYYPLSTTNSMLKPGVIPLITGYTSGKAYAYYASRNIKDNTPGKANVLYMAGHDQSGNVSGTKLALETLLLLGQTTLPPSSTTTEATRATPIVATLGNGDTAVVVGTFENVQPAPIVPVVTATADLTGWSFPFVKGHLRATVSSSISATASALGTGTVDFDASGLIPSVTTTGCATNFAGSCRTVFTTTATPSTTTGIALHPANVFITDGNAATIGALMATGSSLVSGDYTTLVRRILAGYWNGTTYVSQLGGIDRSTAAVIGPSSVANSTRATMIYVGASDGMLHAFCGQVDNAHGCPAMGTELWAFMPRVQLPWVRLNKTKIDGSPRVVDAFGDFSGSGTKSFRTILTFTTGSGDPTSAAAAQPAIYALDITNPQAPSVVWEYSIANPGASRGADAFGVGLSLAAGPVNVAGVTKNIVVAETTNGGTNGASDPGGVVVTALNLETGAALWANPFVYAYPNPTRSSGALVPKSGIPGGAVGVDRQGQGFLTDLVFGDLYGNVWQLDITTGLSRWTNNNGTKKPLFSFSTDGHPIGAVPAIYSTGGQVYAAIVSGGYDDPTGTATWGAGGTQSVVAMALAPPAADVTLSESSASTDIPFKFNLGSGEAGFAQATVVGGQIFVTSDSSNVNAGTFGTTGSTGHVYTSALSATATNVVVQGGAGSVSAAGTTLYAASSSMQQQLATAATSTVGATVDTFRTSRIMRLLWVRTK